MIVRHKKGSVKIYSLLFEHNVMGHAKKFIFFWSHITRYVVCRACKAFNGNFLSQKALHPFLVLNLAIHALENAILFVQTKIDEFLKLKLDGG